MDTQELLVVSGAVIANRLFDIADTIDLTKAEQLWGQRLRGAVTRGRLVSTPPKAVAFGVPPLDIPLDPVMLSLDGIEIQATATARLYDFGAARLALRIDAENFRWNDFAKRLNSVDRCVGLTARNPIWAALLEQVRTTCAGALRNPSRNALEEDYLIGVVRAFDEAPDAEELLRKIDLVQLLSGEERPLSQGARHDLMRQQFSYYADDLVVLTWARAFVYEPRGDSDVIDVLDVANAQLLEMRYYDELLDAELPRMYGLVETTRRARAFLSSSRFANLARRLYTMVAEVTELREKVDNALQVTEDVYLARVYASALELFRVAAVSSTVDRKLAIIRDTYWALYEEASAARAALMEAGILVLIVVEVALSIVRR